MKLYLAGAIQNASDPITWRRNLTTKMPEGWEVIDPTEINLFVGTEDNIEAARRIVTNDLNAIRKCDALLALVNIASWGTGMEIFFAYQLKVPIIIWSPGGKPVGPWLQFHSTVVLSEFADIKVFLRNLLANA
jgi:nucleoside 2-deoxyribosyltransferase